MWALRLKSIKLSKLANYTRQLNMFLKISERGKLPGCSLLVAGLAITNICNIHENCKNYMWQGYCCSWLSTRYQSGRVGSIPGRATPKTWKLCDINAKHEARLENTTLGVDGWVQGNSSREVLPVTPINAAFYSKAAAWPKAQVSGDGRRRPLVTLQKEYRSEHNETELQVKQLSLLAAWPRLHKSLLPLIV